VYKMLVKSHYTVITQGVQKNKATAHCQSKKAPSISQGRVAAHSSYGGVFNDEFIINLPPSRTAID